MFANKIGESSSTTGTGTFSMAGATGAYRTWRTGFSTNTVVFYMASNAAGTIWEIGYGTFATGSPDTLTRNLLQSSTGSLISWVTTPYYIFSIPTAEALAAVVNGGLGTSRPAWAPTGFSWWDDAAGIAVNWIRKLYNGTADVRIGLYDAVKGLYFPDGRRPTTAVGAANKTIAAADIGGFFTYNTTAAARTVTLPAGTTLLKDGFETEHLGLSTAFGLIFTPDAADVIDFGAAGATKAVVGQTPVKIRWDGAANQWRTNYVAPPVPVSNVRQTVSAGPVTTAGLPDFLPATDADLNFGSQNLTSTAPLAVSAANGWSASNGLAVDRVGYSTSNLSWASLTASRAAATPNYLYVTVNADGTLTTGSTLLAPIYQWGGTPATTSGQFTFNISEMKGYLGNGSTAPQAYVVFVGEAATDGTGVISSVAYAYNGQYESAFTATLPGAGTLTSANHNIGVKPRHAAFIIECTTTESNYAVGDQLEANGSFWTTGGARPLALTRTAKTLGFTVGSSSTAFNGLDKSSGGSVGLTLANWKYKFTAARGW